MNQILPLLFRPTGSMAASLNVSSWYGGGISSEEIMSNVFNTLGGSAIAVAAGVFAFGTLLFVLGAFKEEYRTAGKELMINSLIGLAIVVISMTILNTAMYFIYGN